MLDATPEVARTRRLARAGAPELFDDDALQRALSSFYADVERHFEQERIVHVDADGSLEQVAREVLAAVRALGE